MDREVYELRADGVVRNCDAIIRAEVDWQGCVAWRHLAREAEQCRIWYLQDSVDKDSRKRDRAPHELRAWRRYALAAWALRRLEEAAEQARADRESLAEAFRDLPMADLAG